MEIQQIVTGGDRNFGYLVADETTGEALIIDPSYAPQRLVDRAEEKGYRLLAAFCTHDHVDHTNGNEAIERLTGLRVLLYGMTDRKTGTRVEHGARFPLGELTVEVLHTPGHTPDSICLHVADAVFTGDTLFVGKVGGTDFEKGARAEYRSLHDVLLALPDETRVFPGHDYGTATQSTIGTERRTNPFLLRPDFTSFVQLKRTWPEYKKAHGIA
jgi:hydroxyacylglutathione hydrolase